MPRFDGTGPMGLGPLTGRGMGYCAVKLYPSKEGSSLKADRVSMGLPLGFQSPGAVLPLVPRLSRLVPGFPCGFRHGWSAHLRWAGPRR
jgi:hypothetical protein